MWEIILIMRIMIMIIIIIIMIIIIIDEMNKSNLKRENRIKSNQIKT